MDTQLRCALDALADGAARLHPIAGAAIARHLGAGAQDGDADLKVAPTLDLLLHFQRKPEVADSVVRLGENAGKPKDRHADEIVR